MSRTSKTIALSCFMLMALFLVFRDKPLDGNLIQKIGASILLDTTALKECSHDTIIIEFEKFKHCGNDPTTYLYSHSWISPVEEQLNRLDFKTILVDRSSLTMTDRISRVSISCHLENNDVLSTKVGIHVIYQKQFNFKGENILVKDVTLTLKNNQWQPIKKNA